MERIWILNWTNITQDKDFAMYYFALANAWILEWLNVTANTVAPWKAIIKWTRTNGEEVAIAYENTANVTIDTSWTTKVFIKIDQAKLDDWSANLEDWTGVATIQTGASYPAWNYVALASVTTWTITDARVLSLLKTSWLTQDFDTSWNMTANAFFGDWSNLTWLSAEVESTSLNLMLWSTWTVWKAYSLWNYEQLSVWTSNDFWSTAQPRMAQSFYAQSVDITTIKLMIKTVSSPSDNVLIEIQTDNAGVPSWTVVTNWTSDNINYTVLSWTFTEETFNFASVPVLTEGDLYHIVVKRSGWTDAVNYYAVESAWSDVQIWTASVDTWSWANATDDLYFKITSYQLATLGWTNFVWICQLAWTSGEIVKFNKNYDNNQTSLTAWSYYWYNATTWSIEAWWNIFKAISSSEVAFELRNRLISKNQLLIEAGESLTENHIWFIYKGGVTTPTTQSQTTTNWNYLVPYTWSNVYYWHTLWWLTGINKWIKTFSHTYSANGSRSWTTYARLYDDSNKTTLLWTSNAVAWNSWTVPNWTITYTFATPVLVPDTFYIEFQNNNSYYIPTDSTNPYAFGNYWNTSHIEQVWTDFKFDMTYDYEDKVKWNVYEANANDLQRIAVDGMIKKTVLTWEQTIIEKWWIISWFSWLTKGERYYLQNDWSIWLTPWTYTVYIWIATSTTEIYIWENHIVWQTSTTATTGWVSLWNAEWYVTVQIDGETKKIPYFWI